LEAPDETLQAQRRMALELRARTGQAPPGTLATLGPDHVRTASLADWKKHYAKAVGRLQPGEWYYQGKPVS
jgi:hypothetical protein